MPTLGLLQAHLWDYWTAFPVTFLLRSCTVRSTPIGTTGTSSHFRQLCSQVGRCAHHHLRIFARTAPAPAPAPEFPKAGDGILHQASFGRFSCYTAIAVHIPYRLSSETKVNSGEGISVGICRCFAYSDIGGFRPPASSSRGGATGLLC
ncbi:hypothetical protein F4861DRAFT_504347 [Xylaria intraflava]|nr:hypothetical protein F4861DRAFT_504347 [Xylaria intraflava]